MGVWMLGTCTWCWSNFTSTHQIASYVHAVFVADQIFWEGLVIFRSESVAESVLLVKCTVTSLPQVQFVATFMTMNMYMYVFPGPWIPLANSFLPFIPGQFILYINVRFPIMLRYHLAKALPAQQKDVAATKNLLRRNCCILDLEIKFNAFNFHCWYIAAMQFLHTECSTVHFVCHIGQPQLL